MFSFQFIIYPWGSFCFFKFPLSRHKVKHFGLFHCCLELLHDLPHVLYGDLRIPGSAATAHIAVCVKAVATTHVSGGDRAAGEAAGPGGPGTFRLSLLGSRTTGASSPLFFCDFQFLRQRTSSVPRWQMEEFGPYNAIRAHALLCVLVFSISR